MAEPDPQLRKEKLKYLAQHGGQPMPDKDE